MESTNWNVDPGEQPPSREGSWFPSVDPTNVDQPSLEGGTEPASSQPVPDLPPPVPGPPEAVIAGGAPEPPMPPPPAPHPQGPSDQPPAGSRNVKRAAAAAAVAAVLAAGGGFAAGRITHDSSPSQVLSGSRPSNVSQQTGNTVPAPLSGNDEEPAAAVAKLLRPAMVQIESADGLGSGFVYDRSGLILTAAHVVGTDKKVTIQLADATQVNGQVLGADTSTDVAVVKITPPADLAVAQLGTGVQVQAGQMAIAIGSPYGLYQTVTEGIISAVDRTVPTTGKNEVPMLQTDAPINPGNSGGALADRRGRVIGINDSIYSGSGSASDSQAGNVGVGFAVPIDLAKSIADRIVAGKKIEPGFLGVEGQNSTGGRLGAQIVNVTSGSPAGNAGLQSGDIIVGLDGHQISSMSDLAAAVRTRQPGDQVTVTYVRKGEERETTVTLGKTS
jgi:putative serine protease PepD